jgi:hypothetical protein
MSCAKPAMAERRFPPPWTAEVTPNCSMVRDGNGQALSYIYYENELGRRSAAKLLSNWAWRIAANFAKLPELLKVLQKEKPQLGAEASGVERNHYTHATCHPPISNGFQD